MKVIDVSEHQGAINWAKVKASGIDAAIIRAGYGKGNIDKRFADNMKGAKDAGISHLGLYWFSYAYTVDMAKREAQYLNDIAKGESFDLGVYFDWEYDSMNYARKHGVNAGRKLITDMCKAFCERIKELGYIAGYYTNQDYQQNYIDTAELSEFRKWFAKYTNQSQSGCFIWQYSSKGKVDGINGNVDMNDLLGEIEEQNLTGELHDILKVEDIAAEVIAGKWGSGYERKTRLKKAGYDYDAVQAKVNELMKASNSVTSGKPASSVSVVKFVTVRASGGLNIRSKAGTNGRVLGAFPNGARVKLIEKTTTNWWKVSGNIGGVNVEGYCAAKYLKE